MSSPEKITEAAVTLLELGAEVEYLREQAKAAKVFAAILIERLGGDIKISAQDIQAFMSGTKRMRAESINVDTARYFLADGDESLCDCKKCQDMAAAYGQSKH